MENDEKKVSLTLEEWDQVIETVYVAKTKEANLGDQERSKKLEEIKEKIRKQLPGYC